MKDCLAWVPDPRQGQNTTYSVSDLIQSAFACFFSQDPSFLQFQKRMEDRTSQSNLQTIFGIKKVPTDDQIRNVLDFIDPSCFDQVFYKIITYLLNKNALNDYKVLNKKYLVMAIDGTKYFSSTAIHCQNCNIINHSNGKIEYTHTILGASIVSPYTNIVLPLPCENNIKEDGNNKQDCEQNATKRWLAKNNNKLKDLIKDKKVIVLTDDLHCNDVFISLLKQNGFNYILTCKENSHKDIFEYTKFNKMQEISYYDNVNGLKEQKKHTIQWLSGLPLFDMHESNTVNLVILTIPKAKKCKIELNEVEKKGKKVKKFIETYHDLEFSFVTDIKINKNNIKEITDIGRARWKIENNNFEVLKNHGYNIKHNFGHGKIFLSATLIKLNILAFLFHSALYLLDNLWKNLYDKCGNRKVFFDMIKNTLRILIFDSLSHLFSILLNGRSPPTDEINKLSFEIIRLKTEVDYYKGLIKN
jgi:hypothetical protein